LQKPNCPQCPNVLLCCSEYKCLVWCANCFCINWAKKIIVAPTMPSQKLLAEQRVPYIVPARSLGKEFLRDHPKFCRDPAKSQFLFEFALLCPVSLPGQDVPPKEAVLYNCLPVASCSQCVGPHRKIWDHLLEDKYIQTWLADGTLKRWMNFAINCSPFRRAAYL